MLWILWYFTKMKWFNFIYLKQNTFTFISYLAGALAVSVTSWKICEAVTISNFLVYPQHPNTCAVKEDVNSKYAIQLHKLYIFASGYIL